MDAIGLYIHDTITRTVTMIYRVCRVIVVAFVNLVAITALSNNNIRK